MNSRVINTILEKTEAQEVTHTDLIQSLWNQYGELLRIHLKGGTRESVILKHIKLPQSKSHPKGFNTNLSHQRKLKSYQVETHWYERFNHINRESSGSPTAQKLASFQQDGEFFILLEDLNTVGYEERLSSANWEDMKLVLSWLSCFHAKFIIEPSHEKDKGLWQQGTYWHLETRPDELQRLSQEDPKLRKFSGLIDKRLSHTRYLTIVHGDAKLANFCFSKKRDKVAAVDFQYVGYGCGMKDVAYFVGSCLNETECEEFEEKILDFYFHELSKNLENSPVDIRTLELEWRELYHFAWADFHRFLKGWSPGHWKINSYSETICQKIRDQITNELLSAAQEACLKAGSHVRQKWQTDIGISKKEGHSESSQVVTEVDLQSQTIILKSLQPSIQKYDLGLLTEEESDDQSRLKKDFFWVIDPIDGTLPFSKGESGFAISIALVSRSGKTLIGTVYDPVSKTLYHAVEGGGSFQNNQPLVKGPLNQKGPIQLYADLSLRKDPQFSKLEETFSIHFIGGAVINAINVLLNGNACYFKFPKETLGGCAIWDLAATQLIVNEAGGVATTFNGQPLSFNNPENLHFNKTGLLYASCPSIHRKVAELL